MITKNIHDVDEWRSLIFWQPSRDRKFSPGNQKIRLPHHHQSQSYYSLRPSLWLLQTSSEIRLVDWKTQRRKPSPSMPQLRHNTDLSLFINYHLLVIYFFLWIKSVLCKSCKMSRAVAVESLNVSKKVQYHPLALVGRQMSSNHSKCPISFSVALEPVMSLEKTLVKCLRMSNPVL